jgi:protein-L-isoaspartate(D-aspartate) O-methyltransferase
VIAMQTGVERARFNMIQQQVRPWGVLDERVLEVMATVRREAFVPDAYQALAYADIEIPITDATAMLAPKVVAHMLQALAVQPGDRVLQIGLGTGYVSACLRELGGRVTGVEIDPALAEEARRRLEAQGVDGVHTECRDGLGEPVPGGPFDAIAITGSMPTEAALPLLQAELAPGGRLFCILGSEPVMEAVLITRVGERGFRRLALFETCAPALTNATPADVFEF